MGVRTAIGFGKDQELQDLFNNLNEKLKDLGAFVETLKLES